jgi:hypothetical protein
MLLVLKLATLLAFAGGPLYVSDRLRALLDPRLAFALAFAPLAVILFGALTLHDEDSAFSRGVTRAGLAAALVLGAQNAWLLHGLMIARDSATPGLHAMGLLAGTLTAAAYARLGWRRLREGPLAPGWSWRLPPRTGDWLALGVCTAGALGALLLYPKEPDQSITVFVLFGGMAAFMALHLRGWRAFERRVRVGVEPLVLSDGTVLRPARRRVLAGFSALLAYGGILSYFGHGFELVFRCITAGLALLGALGVALALLRVIPPGQLRIERHALFVRRWRYTLEVPWHVIDAVYMSELYGSRMVCVELSVLHLVGVDPPQASTRALRALAQGVAFTGAPLMFASSLYDVDAIGLMEALQRRAEAARGADFAEGAQGSARWRP